MDLNNQAAATMGEVTKYLKGAVEFGKEQMPQVVEQLRLLLLLLLMGTE